MFKRIQLLPLMLLSTLLFSCGGGQSNKASDSNSSSDITSDGLVEVAAKLLRAGDFSYDLISNGVVSARSSAEMRFQAQELISDIYVRNGQRVEKGQKLATLDKFKLENSFRQAEEAFERAKLDLQDVLIGQGYSLNAPDDIPDEVMKIARIRSNYQQSSNSYKVAQYNLDAATLYAPFGGVVANLTAKTHNLPGNEPFCVIINNADLETVFHVLEGELPYINVGDRIAVSAFSAADKEVWGKVTEINPVVGKNGMVQVKAAINGSGQKLYEGMKVKVRVERLLGERLVVPKSAVVLRANREVVFTLKNGKAQWNYIKTAQENSSSFVIVEGLNPGDSVIYEGNLNLAHEAPVIVRK